MSRLPCVVLAALVGAQLWWLLSAGGSPHQRSDGGTVPRNTSQEGDGR